MRVTCDATVVDRSKPQYRCRPLKSIVSVGYHKSSNEQNSEMFLLYENVQNKSGQRYKVSQNVSKVFTKFLNDGKATISFKEPPHDLLIQCDKIRLLALLSTVRMELCGESKTQASSSNSTERKLPRLKEIPFTLKNHVNRKMVVKHRSDMDKGIPRTVEDLTVRTSRDNKNFLF